MRVDLTRWHRLCNAHGLITQAERARAFGVGRVYISAIEQPGLRNLSRVAVGATFMAKVLLAMPRRETAGLFVPVDPESVLLGGATA